MSVTVLRRILRALVVKQRASGQSADRAAWEKEDLIFAANFGKSGERELAFVHFSDGASTGDLPVMKVLGWNHRDTTLHNRHAGELLSKRLGWPNDPADQRKWRGQWASAFEVGHREVITTSKELAVRLAALAGDIRARAIQLLAAESETGPMRVMLEAFRKNLIHDLDADGFADMFAQTICYGMLAARISRPVGIIADNLADMVPKTNPFLKELFANFLHIGGRDKRQGMDFDELGVRDVVDMLNRANMEAVLRDFGDKNPKEDPVIHFYELFLKEYDPQKRMQRGVFYTPRPVVNFIVRGVDEILCTEFGLPLGLADTSTWAELAARNDKITIPDHVDPNNPFVQILDPATGTGTFLVEVIDLIHKRMVETWKAEGKAATEIKAAWNAYVPKHLLPRLTAFELMMAPYAIAHMKIGLKLVETGYTFGSDERAHVFLTNALEPAHDLDMQFDFMSTALAHEAAAANRAKEKIAFTTIVGNPPYAGISANMSEFAESLINKYRFIEGVPLGERRSWLQNDYVKFHGLADSYLQRSGVGVFGMITDNSYVDGPTFRGLRAAWLSQSRKVYVFDLAGKATIVDERSVGRDENVFEIGQGTSILLSAFDKSSASFDKCFATVMHGTVEKKLELLSTSNIAAAGFSKGFPRHPLFEFFSPPLGDQEKEYESHTSMSDFFGLKCVGVQTSRDPLAIALDNDDFDRKIRYFCSGPIQEVREEFFRDQTKSKYPRGDTRQWSVTAARADIERLNFHLPTASLAFRPFDVRVFAKTTLLSDWPRPELQSEIMEGNPLLSILRRTENKRSYDYVFVSEAVPWNHHVSIKDGTYGIPLWLKPSVGEAHRRPNIDRNWADVVGKVLKLSYEDGIPRGQQGCLGKDFITPRAQQIGLLDTPWDGRGDLAKAFGPRDLFDYIYAVLHAPSYRSRYAEFLKSDFPRIPTPGSRALFADLVPLGRELVALHLLKPDEASVLKTPEIRFAGTGEARVAKGYPEYTNGKVMINASRWFEDVPKATWEFHVGGYQPCEKWLKDRAAKGGKKQSDGRVLTDEDTLHYRRMVVALTETRRIMAEIDKVIESHGGWPGAFKVGAE